MESANSFEEAKKILRQSCKILQDENSSNLEKLDALKEALEAEKSIQEMETAKGKSELDYWEERYRIATNLKQYYLEAKRQARVAAEEAKKKTMAEHFASLPVDIVESMNVTLDGSDWEFTTEY